MSRARRACLTFVPVVVLSCVLAAPALAKEKRKEKEKLAAAYSMVILPEAGSDNQSPSELSVEIERFTTPEERANLRSILQSKGQNAALTAAQNSPVGRLSRPASLATNILYAWQEPDPAGNRITIVTLRYSIHPNMVMNADPMLEPFTLAWFVPAADGKGKGKIIGSAALKLDKDGKLDISAYPASTADLAYVKIR